jgi:hypothetical protein
MSCPLRYVLAGSASGYTTLAALTFRDAANNTHAAGYSIVSLMRMNTDSGISMPSAAGFYRAAADTLEDRAIIVQLQLTFAQLVAR